MNFTFRFRKSRLHWLLAGISFMALIACSERSIAMDAEDGSAVPAIGTWVDLTLTGYNYTNRHIDRFSVNANAGGNLHVSSPTGGGGGSMCCVRYLVGAKPWQLRIRWQSDACVYTRTYSDGEQDEEIHYYFQERQIVLDKAIADRPNYLEVHFFPDGHVEAAVTEDSSPPRLRLSKEREDKSPYRKCQNGKRPIEKQNG